MSVSRDRSREEMEVFELFSQVRWPRGFVCPRCRSKDAKKLERRLSFQCNGCRYQCRVVSGTKLEGTRVPLHKIFLALKGLVARRREDWSNPGHWEGGGVRGRKLKWVQTEKPEFVGYSGKITVRALLGEDVLNTRSLGTVHRFRTRILERCMALSDFRHEPDNTKCLRALLAFLMAPDP